MLRWGASAEADVLLSAAEERCTGVHVRPQRGAACVFWTMDETGVDAASWHNGARVRHRAGGKWIVQKFKELPREWRGIDQPLALPPSLAPRPLLLSDGHLTTDE